MLKFNRKNTRLQHPVPLAEDRLNGAVGQLAVDIQLGGADHEVDMGQTDISTALKQLFAAQAYTTFDIDRIGTPERKVAGRILIDSGVVEYTVQT
ncbi:hypothetical protein D3C81_1912540 [compost metagenome]